MLITWKISRIRRVKVRIWTRECRWNYQKFKRFNQRYDYENQIRSKLKNEFNKKNEKQIEISRWIRNDWN